MVNEIALQKLFRSGGSAHAPRAEGGTRPEKDEG